MAGELTPRTSGVNTASNFQQISPPEARFSPKTYHPDYVIPRHNRCNSPRATASRGKNTDHQREYHG